MMLQTMIVKNGLIRMNDQYPRNPRQTIRMTRTTSSSFGALSFRDRSSSFTLRVLFASKGHDQFTASLIPSQRPRSHFARPPAAAISLRRSSCHARLPLRHPKGQSRTRQRTGPTDRKSRRYFRFHYPQTSDPQENNRPASLYDGGRLFLPSRNEHS